MITEDELQDIISAIRGTLTVKRIMVFGSYARGDAHQDSDLDLCVVVETPAEQPLEEWPSKSWLYRATDLIERFSSEEVALVPYVFTSGEIEALRDRQHPLVEQILEEGRVVYEQ
jgi:predicted nucleotidyltransferase